MIVTKWTTVDVRYNKGEEKKAEQVRKYLEKIGYELQEQDAGDYPYDYDDQYIKNGKTRIIS
jgi:nitrogenase molybdenum-iron protein alpha/beta subunit